MPHEGIAVSSQRQPGRNSYHAALSDCGTSDPIWQAVELAQRGRMVLDVSEADLEAAEAVLGAFHPTTWYFRNAWYEARNAWDRLRARHGGATLSAALEEWPRTVLALGPGAELVGPAPDGRWALPAPGPDSARPVLLIPIGGQTYRVLRVEGTPAAPLLVRLTRLRPALTHGPYYAGRLCDGSVQCDCAEWTYQADGDDAQPPAPCKHLKALAALRWL